MSIVTKNGSGPCRIRIEDLPAAETLSEEELDRIFGAGKKKPVQLGVEGLESREMMASNLTASFSGGILKIEGTDGADKIRVWQSNDRIGVDGIDIAAQQKLFWGISLPISLPDVRQSSVNKIQVLGLGGDDTVTFNAETESTQKTLINRAVVDYGSDDYESDVTQGQSTGDGATLAKPTVLGPGDLTTLDSPIFSWSASSDATRYELWVNNNTTNESKVVYRTDLIENTFALDGELAKGTYNAYGNYTFRVQTWGSYGVPQPLGIRMPSCRFRTTAIWSSRPKTVPSSGRLNRARAGPSWMATYCTSAVHLSGVAIRGRIAQVPLRL